MPKKILAPIVLVIAVALGLAIVPLYERYKDDFGSFIWGDKNTSTNTISDEEDIITFPPETWGFAKGVLGEWRFEVFQPEVVGYKTVDGINYVVGDYEVNGSVYTVDIIVSRDGQLLPSSWEQSTREAMEAVLEDRIFLQETYNNLRFEDVAEGEYISFEQLKDMFPVGDPIAIAYLAYYPLPEERTESLCSQSEGMCSWGEVYDALVPNLEDFLSQGFVDTEEGFLLIAYSASEDLYRIGRQSAEEKEFLERQERLIQDQDD